MKRYCLAFHCSLASGVLLSSFFSSVGTGSVFDSVIYALLRKKSIGNVWEVDTSGVEEVSMGYGLGSERVYLVILGVRSVERLLLEFLTLFCY